MFRKWLGLVLILAASDANAALEVSLLTFEPGATVFESFGHTALLVEDSEHTALTTVYQYGTVDARAFWSGRNPLKNFQQLFAQKLSTKAEKIYLRVDASSGLSTYVLNKLTAESARKAIINELVLTDEQAHKLVALVEDDIKAGRYEYHSYEANCATKIRDRLFDDSIFGAEARKSAQEKILESTSRETLFAATLDEAAQLATGKKVKLAPTVFLENSQTKMAIQMFGLPATEYASSKEFVDAMVATEESLRANTFLGSFVGQDQVDLLLTSFHEYFFGEAIKKMPITEYESMLLPKNLRSSILRIINPATGKPVVSPVEFQVERSENGPVVNKINLL